MALELKMNFNWRQPHKAVQATIVILPLALIIGLSVFLLFMPKLDEKKKIEKKIEAQEKEIAKSQSMVAKLDELLAENKKLLEKLKELEDQLPEENEISTLLKQITELTHEASLEVLSWRPSSKRNHSSGIVYEVPVSVQLTGGYHRLGQFFASLTKLDRIVNLTNITLGGATPEGKDSVKLSVSFTAVTFTAVPDQSLSGATSAASGKK